MLGTLVTSGMNPAAGTTFTSSATCPAGKILLGGGGRVTQSDAATQEAKIALVESYPSTSTTWTAVGVANANITSNTTVTVQAFAVCSS